MRTKHRLVAALTLNITAFILIVLAVLLSSGTKASAAQAPVGLGTASSFAVLAGSTITNTGPTRIIGDVGLHPGSSVTGFNTVILSGSLHVADAVAEQAKVDLATAYNDAAGRGPATTVSTELGGQTLKAGVYDSASGTFGLTGTLTLDAGGKPNAVFIFKTASTLITASGSRVNLINGGSACNIFWKVGSSATLGTTTSFQGNILALASISLNTGATAIPGRLLARTGAVTLQTNTISRSACSSGSTPSPSPTSTSTSTSNPTPAPTSTSTANPNPNPTSTSTSTANPNPNPTSTSTSTANPNPNPSISPSVLGSRLARTGPDSVMRLAVGSLIAVSFSLALFATARRRQTLITPEGHDPREENTWENS